MSIQGYYLNLKTSKFRNTSLKKHLKEIKLDNHFQDLKHKTDKIKILGINKGEYGL